MPAPTVRPMASMPSGGWSTSSRGALHRERAGVRRAHWKNGFRDYGVRLNRAGGSAFDRRLSASRRERDDVRTALSGTSARGLALFPVAHLQHRPLQRSAAVVATEELGLQVGARSVSEGDSKRAPRPTSTIRPTSGRTARFTCNSAGGAVVDAGTVLSVQYFHQGERAGRSWPW